MMIHNDTHIEEELKTGRSIMHGASPFLFFYEEEKKGVDKCHTFYIME
jgi:hypothetical protein